MADSERWSYVIELASRPPAGGPARRSALHEVLSMGASLTQSSVGCSITQVTPTGFTTPQFVGELASRLDAAQYDAGDGPCIAACRDQLTHSIRVMADEATYPTFAAAAAACGVRSSLSLPLSEVAPAAALNLYAADTSAFDGSRARAVSHLLTRCAAAILRDHPDPLTSSVDAGLLAAARDAHDNAVRARKRLEDQFGLSPSEAFYRLVQRSRVEHRRLNDVAREVLG